MSKEILARVVLFHSDNRTFYTLLHWGLKERPALLLSPYVNLPKNPSEQEVERAVTLALVKVLERSVGTCEVSVIFSERRDDRRGHL
jgi:hypothetical protein